MKPANSAANHFVPQVDITYLGFDMQLFEGEQSRDGAGRDRLRFFRGRA